MQTVRDLSGLRHAVAELRRTSAGERPAIALVPTMGALHDGHMGLVAAAHDVAAHVVVSIFVNPAQFGPKEDLSAYPRPEAADTLLLSAAGVSVLWMPPVEVVYPAGHTTRITVSGITDGLCGASRPGHFDGVATVVAKLFNQVQPDVALFGEKDWQQLAVIRRMAADLDFAFPIVGVPTVREADGLARSSRNAYLSAEQRRIAAALPRALTAARNALGAGEARDAVLARAQATLIDAGFDSVDYLTLADAATLLPATTPAGARLFVAARLGKTRLIDNIAADA